MIRKNMLISFTIGSVIITGLIGLYKWKYNHSKNIINNQHEEDITTIKEDKEDITNKEQDILESKLDLEENITNKD